MGDRQNAFTMANKSKYILSKAIYSFGIAFCFCLLTILSSTAQTGNYVAAGTEASNFGTIDLATPSGTTWATDRSSNPGFFSAVGTATYTGASNTANINGYVKHYVTAANQGFSFPVGSGTALRTLVTSGTIANNTVYATAWIAGNPTTVIDPTDASPGTHATTAMASGVTAVSSVGQWDWLVSSGSANGVTVTVNIPDMTSLGSAAQLRLVGWNGTQWVNLSGTSGASGNTAGSTLSGTMINGITAIGIGVASTDSDGDGIPDDTDQDDDNDGIPDSVEGTGDTDGDGILDSRDLDSDNDGINDVIEAGGTDANGDGKLDGTPNGTTGQIGSGLTPINSDNDTVPDYKDLDSDNDGVSDLQEGGSNGTDADNDGVVDGPDTDGDGIPDSVDGFVGFGDANSPALPNGDGDTLPDYRDVDSDNDGTMDIVEKANKGALDANNDGQVDNPTDPDGDGIANNSGLDTKPAAFGGLGTATGPAAVDLFPNFTFGGAGFTVNTSKTIVININEIKGAATSSTVQVFVPFSTGFTFNFNATATSVTVIGTETVNNPDWSVTTTSTGLLFSTKAGVSIPANGRSRIAISITANTAGTDASVTANVTPVVAETNAYNNIAVVGISIQN